MATGIDAQTENGLSDGIEADKSNRLNIGIDAVSLVINQAGFELALKIGAQLGYPIWHSKDFESFKVMVEKAWYTYKTLIFYGATGIVVRAIAPHLQSKFEDPAVVVVDVAGKFAISLLSGHVGGANDAAIRVSQCLGAQPVITTGTDALGKSALDTWLLGKAIAPRFYRDEILAINAQLLLSRADTFEVTETPDDLEIRVDQLAVVITKPKYAIGLGFKEGKTYQELLSAIETACAEFGITLKQIKQVGTIPRKAAEQGFKDLIHKTGWQGVEVSLDAILSIQDAFEGSDFVEKTLGVRAVAQPCARLASGNGHISQRYAIDGVTVAIGKILDSSSHGE